MSSTGTITDISSQIAPTATDISSQIAPATIPIVSTPSVSVGGSSPVPDNLILLGVVGIISMVVIAALAFAFVSHR
jgi:hypothetical protein